MLKKVVSEFLWTRSFTADFIKLADQPCRSWGLFSAESAVKLMACWCCEVVALRDQITPVSRPVSYMNSVAAFDCAQPCASSNTIDSLLAGSKAVHKPVALTTFLYNKDTSLLTSLYTECRGLMRVAVCPLYSHVRPACRGVYIAARGIAFGGFVWVRSCT